MAVKFRSVSTATNTTGTNATTLTVARPSQLANGDTMIAVTSGLQSTTFSPPASGWTHIGTFQDAAGLESRAYKKTANNEAASELWTFTTGTGSAISISVAAFVGGYDLHTWSAVVTSTADPASLPDLDAARDCVAWQVYAWQNATADSTATWSFGSEKHDVTSKAAGAIWRGQTGMYYGQPDVADIVNAGEALAGALVNPSTTPTHAIGWSFLVDTKEADAETWSSTDGDFAVELKLDVDEIDSVGSITSRFRGDITSAVAAFAATVETQPASNAADGDPATAWVDTTTASNQWIRYDFGASAAKTIRRYRLTSASATPALDPMNWTLEGSADASSWTVLDTRANESFGARGEVREFRVASPAAFRYYRLLVSANLSSNASVGVQVAEFRLSDISVWEDITSYVVEESKIRITRGLQGSSGRSDFSRAYYELNNTDGRFSLRNQSSPYFGALQRNTETRISKAYGTKALQLQGEVALEGTETIGDSVRCPLTFANSVPDDMDVRIDVEPESWRQEQALAGASGAPDSFSAWRWTLLDDGRLEFSWYTGSTVETFESTVAVPQTSSRLSLRVTHTSSGGLNVITFYTADTFGGSYTQLGAAVGGSTFSTQSHTGGALHVGHVPAEPVGAFHGLVYNFELRDGVTLVADVDFTALANGTHSFTDAQGNTWATVGNAVVSNRRYRFHGEVPEWPLSWDPTGVWITASSTGAGVQRRLERDKSEASTMRRYHTKATVENPQPFDVYAAPVAYWPLEDGSDAFQLASGLSAKPPMQIFGTPDWEGDASDAFEESGPLIRLNNAHYAGPVAGAEVGIVDLRWLFHAPTALVANDAIMSFYTSGQVRRWDIRYQDAASWALLGYTEAASESSSPVPIVTISLPVAGTTGELIHARLLLAQDGADFDYRFDAFDVYGTELGSVLNTFANRNIGRIYQVDVNTFGDIEDAYVGHVAVYGFSAPRFAGSELNAHQYETAGNRIKRLANEERVEFRAVGALGESTFLGTQAPEPPFQVMSSAAVSDDGYLTDPLDAFGVEYRTTRSLLNQAAHLTLSYTGNELSGELVPTPDDAHLLNDFTAQRGGAGSARYRLTDGPLSIQAPPNGVGTYGDSQSYSLAHEGQCIDIASWQVHKGTVDEDRYPRIQVALENIRIAADPVLTEKILRMDVGKRVDITDTPDFLPAEDIRQIVIGYEERFDNFQHGFSINAIPERVFEVARYDSGDRFASHDSALYKDVSASATSFEVVNQTGQPWSDTASDFDIVVDGERMTVTSVADVTSFYSTDSFNRADSTTNLGSTDGGTVSAWTQRLGTWGINAATAYVSVTTNSIATIPASADFEEVSLSVPTLPATRDAWVNFRYSDNGNRWRWGGTQGTTARLEKVVAGVVTTYTADASFAIAAGVTLSARAHGSVIEVFLNGRPVMTISDTFNQTAAIVGMQIAANDVRIDNFRWVASNPRQLLTVTRNVGQPSAFAHKAGTGVTLYKPPYRGI